jgi:hypothetical protein
MSPAIVFFIGFILMCAAIVFFRWRLRDLPQFMIIRRMRWVVSISIFVVISGIGTVLLPIKNLPVFILAVAIIVGLLVWGGTFIYGIINPKVWSTKNPEDIDHRKDQ